MVVILMVLVEMNTETLISFNSKEEFYQYVDREWVIDSIVS